MHLYSCHLILQLDSQISPPPLNSGSIPLALSNSSVTVAQFRDLAFVVLTAVAHTEATHLPQVIVLPINLPVSILSPKSNSLLMESRDMFFFFPF